ncbi:unnamed protein product [Amoebophrya sp. A25]|nr:unnamed protein product [Amoebophrya sp. A25]|eukprot:GSA25T00009304001.1
MSTSKNSDLKMTSPGADGLARPLLLAREDVFRGTTSLEVLRETPLWVPCFISFLSLFGYCAVAKFLVVVLADVGFDPTQIAATIFLNRCGSIFGTLVVARYVDQAVRKSQKTAEEDRVDGRRSTTTPTTSSSTVLHTSIWSCMLVELVCFTLVPFALLVFASAGTDVQLYSVSFLLFLGAAANAGYGSPLTVLVLRFIKRYNERAGKQNHPTTDYGSIMKYGPIGWGSSALFLGFTFDLFGKWVVFASFTISFGLVTFLAFTFFRDCASEDGGTNDETQGRPGDNKAHKRTTSTSGGQQIFLKTSTCSDSQGQEAPDYIRRASTPETASSSSRSTSSFYSTYSILVLLHLCLYGIAKSGSDDFLFVFLRRTLHAPATILGLSVGVMCTAEVPVFSYFESKLFPLFRNSVVRVFLFCDLVLAVRYLLYSGLQNPYLVLFIEPLHGITYALMWQAAVRFATNISTEQTRTTAQALVGASYRQFGLMLGSLIWGPLSTAYGFRVVYLACSQLLVVICGLFGLAFWGLAGVL